ncbi:MAG: DUF3782 domain-containing protein [Microcystaceae cyanobacterium]
MARTADDVWELLAQLLEAQKETERRVQETERLFQEYAEEAQRSRQEAQRSRQETDRRFQEYAEEAQRSRQATDRQIKEVNKQIGNLGGKWGRFVENMVAPACETLFLNRGITVHFVSQRVKARLDNETLEIDILVTNEDHILVVEVKSSLGVDNVKELIEDLGEFKRFFPEYNYKQLYGAVAGIDIEEGADKYAYRKGLFVLAQAGENMAILNNETFQPKAW